MALERDLYLSHELSCLAGLCPKLSKRMLAFGELSRSEVYGLTLFSVVRLADEPALPFCKRKGKSKIPPSTLIFFFFPRKMKYENRDEPVPGFKKACQSSGHGGGRGLAEKPVCFRHSSPLVVPDDLAPSPRQLPSSPKLLKKARCERFPMEAAH